MRLKQLPIGHRQVVAAQQAWPMLHGAAFQLPAHLAGCLVLPGSKSRRLPGWQSGRPKYPPPPLPPLLAGWLAPCSAKAAGADKLIGLSASHASDSTLGMSASSAAATSASRAEDPRLPLLRFLLRKLVLPLLLVCIFSAAALPVLEARSLAALPTLKPAACQVLLAHASESSLSSCCGRSGLGGSSALLAVPSRAPVASGRAGTVPMKEPMPASFCCNKSPSLLLLLLRLPLLLLLLLLRSTGLGSSQGCDCAAEGGLLYRRDSSGCCSRDAQAMVGTAGSDARLAWVPGQPSCAGQKDECGCRPGIAGGSGGSGGQYAPICCWCCCGRCCGCWCCGGAQPGMAHGGGSGGGGGPRLEDRARCGL